MYIKLKLNKNYFSNPIADKLKANVYVLVLSVPCTLLNPFEYCKFSKGDRDDGIFPITAIAKRTVCNVWISSTPIIFSDMMLTSITAIARTSRIMIIIYRGKLFWYIESYVSLAFIPSVRKEVEMVVLSKISGSS